MSEGQKSKVVKLPAAAKKMSEKKWGVLAMKPGFVIFPSLLLRAQKRLRLTCTQLTVLMQLCEFWWYDDRLPWPKKETLAQRVGLSEKQVQRVINQLDEAGFVKRIPRMTKHGQTSNAYDLSGLVKKLAVIAPDFIEAAQAKHKVEKPGHKLHGLKA